MMIDNITGGHSYRSSDLRKIKSKCLVKSSFLMGFIKIYEVHARVRLFVVLSTTAVYVDHVGLGRSTVLMVCGTGPNTRRFPSVTRSVSTS